MRDYGVVTPAFWIGETGKQLRGDANAQLLAMYLMTSPHSSMTGVFHCPVIYMAHETGLPLEGASKALERLSEVGFCEYDEASETVFVINMASFQIAESLKPGDNRIAGIKKEVAKMTPAVLRERFIAIYSVAFCLEIQPEKTSPSKAPPKPRTGTGARTGNKDSLSAAKLPTCPTEKIVEIYNDMLPEMASVRVMDEARKKAIKDRWDWVFTSKKPDGSKRAETSEQAIEWFKSYFEVARGNDFLMGRVDRGADHKNWKPDIEYMLSSRGLKQVIEKTGDAQ